MPNFATMKVAGFSFIRNAVKFDYPIIEAIQSVLPICDEFIIALGESEDNTFELINSLKSDKIKIIHTKWDETLREGGRVLAEETNKAFSHISKDVDWAFYIQGDEVLHEDGLYEVNQAMMKYKDDKRVEGFLFNYRHFYGSYDFIGDSRRWYRKEIRIIRPLKNISSYKDAQGFRIDGRKLRVISLQAYIHHYGWVKTPEAQQEKQKSFNKLWHDDNWMKKNIGDDKSFDYSEIDSIRYFDGTHPLVMNNRIKNKNWSFDFDPTKKKLSFKSRFLHGVELISGWRIGEYKNYKIIK